MSDQRSTSDDALDEFVAARVDELGIPGAAVGVLWEGRGLVSCHGVTSVADPLPVTADTLFHLGSTTKTMTATAIMVLVEQGRLTLDDLVADHLPIETSDPSVRESVRVGQLLDHTAGWLGDVAPGPDFSGAALATATRTMLAQVPQILPPGEQVSYNNLSLMVAGWLVEAVTGMTFEQATRDLVLAPLGMDDTFFNPWEIAGRRYAPGHSPGPTVARGWPMVRGMGPAGTAVSTIDDTLTWASYHLDGTVSGSAPLKDENRLLMQEPRATAASALSGVGVSWLLKDRGDLRLVTHGGNVSNLQISTFVLAPEIGLAVATLANSREGQQLGDAVLDWALEHLASVSPPTPREPMATPDLAPYLGRFDSGQWVTEVTSRDGRLFVQNVLPDIAEVTDEIRAAFERPPVEVVFVDRDVVAPVDDLTQPMGDFGREDDDVAWFRWSLRIGRRT